MQDPLKPAEAGTHCPHIQHGELKPAQAQATSSSRQLPPLTDLLLGNAEGVLLDAVTVCSGTAGGLDAAHESLLTLLQAQTDVLELGEIRPGNSLVLVFCTSQTKQKSGSQPRAVPSWSPGAICSTEVLGVSAQVENEANQVNSF